MLFCFLFCYMPFACQFDVAVLLSKHAGRIEHRGEECSPECDRMSVAPSRLLLAALAPPFTEEGDVSFLNSLRRQLAKIGRRLGV